MSTSLLGTLTIMFQHLIDYGWQNSLERTTRALKGIALFKTISERNTGNAGVLILATGNGFVSARPKSGLDD
jgi:hypothetical protein